MFIKMKKNIKWCLIVLTILINLFSISEAQEKPILAILPFLVEKQGVCPLCKALFLKGKILPGAEEILRRILQNKIESMMIFEVLQKEEIEKFISSKDYQEIRRNPLLYSIRIGRMLKADFLFIGFLFRFEERRGSSFGVEKPASVGFDIHLIRLKDGAEVWRGRFDETQRPLSENLLKIGAFLRRKASWLTAEELSTVGIDEIFMKFPGIKEIEEK